MSITITTLEVGNRIKLTNTDGFYFEDHRSASLQDAGYKGTPDTIHGTGNAVRVPAGAGFIVTRVHLDDSTLDGWMIWRDDAGRLNAGWGRGFGVSYFDRYGRNFVSRLPGEPKPGEGAPPKQGGSKGLSQEAQAALYSTCPKCKSGTLVEKQGRFGAFVGCDGFPKCDFIWKKGHNENNNGDTPMPQVQPQVQDVVQVQPKVQDDDAKALAELLGRIAGNKAQPVDEGMVRRIIADELGKLQPGKVEYHVRVNKGEAKQIKSRPHKAMAEVLRRAQMKNHRGMRVSQLLVGEAGTGKSTLCENVAEAMNLPFVYLSCSGGMSETKLVGRLTPNLQTGEEKYTPTPLVHAWEFGGVTLVDEIDAADPNVLLVLNGMMEATHWTAPDGRTIQRHADFILLAAANTYGNGADRKYVGRNQLDAAFLDRWLVVTVDYDTDLEETLVTTKGLAAKWVRCRTKLRELNMRRVLSTRSLLRADMLVQQLDMPQREAVVAATEGWSQDEREKVGLI